MPLKATGQPDRWILASGSLLLLLSIGLFVYTQNLLFMGIPFAVVLAIWPLLNWKSFFWFLILCIPLSARISFLNDRLATTFPDEQIMWLFVPVLLSILAYNYKSIPGWFLRHPLTLILALQFIWLLVAVGFSQNYLPSLKYLAAKSWFLTSFIILPVLVVKTKKDFKKLFLLFAIPVTLHAIVAFIWHYHRNFDFFASNYVVKPFYDNHVDYSTVLSMLFPLFIIAYRLSKGKKYQRLLLLAVILFYLPAIYVASARAALLAVVFAFVVAYAVRKKIAQWIMPFGFTTIFLLIAFLAHNNKYIDFKPDIRFTRTQDTFLEAVTGMFTGTDMSSMERFYRWIASVRLSTEHPLVGVGPNNFYDHYKGHAVSMFQTWVSRNPERSTTHNYFLFMLVEQGWPAMILYGTLVMAVLLHGQRIYHRARDPFYKQATLGLIMVFAAGFVNNFFSELLETHKVGALFYLSISLLIVIDYQVRKQNKEVTHTPHYRR